MLPASYNYYKLKMW